MDALSARIKRLRARAKLSKAALSRRVGVSDVTISYWESGTIKQIGHERLQALAEALDCSLNDLLDDAPSPPPRQVILTLISNKPAPWLDPQATMTSLTHNLPFASKSSDCFLVTPGKGECFDFLAEGDLAAVLPLDQFKCDGLYLLDDSCRLVVRQLREPQRGQVAIQDERNQVETFSSHDLPYKLVGQVQARWHLSTHEVSPALQSAQ